MSLTIKHLNSDASFLLTFQPNEPFLPSAERSLNSFTILLDPWLSGESKIWHPKFSVSRQKIPPCISSLSALQEPDLVIITQNKSDHCHEETLKTLPSSGGKTLILAEPSSAKEIRSWKYFESSKVVTLPKWNARRPSTIHRISLPPLDPAGMPGEITVAFIAQKPDMNGLHSAVGITYRSPSPSSFNLPPNPKTHTFPLTPPDSPRSIYSNTASSRAISCIYSPHGCSYKTIMPYASSHLVPSGALPLTALLHCFDRISNPWYLGGNICSGFPGGVEIAQNLLAQCWISAHDGDKEISGFATSRTQMRKWARDEVEQVVSPRSDKFPDRKIGTEVFVLDVGEERTVWPGM